VEAAYLSSERGGEPLRVVTLRERDGEVRV
jgi:hypothetical protein